MSAQPAISPRPIPTADDLARAVKLFHAPGEWTDERQAEWNRLTGSGPEEVRAMSSVLVEMADAVLESGVRIDLGSVEAGGR